MKNVFSKSAIVIACAVLMSACSGGGSSSGGSSGGTPTPAPPAPATQPVNTSIQAASYATTSAESGFYEAVNQMRGATGLSYLNQSTSLDTASAAQSGYLATNLTTPQLGAIDPATGLFYLSSEDVGASGFYQTTPQLRATKAGYAGTVNEIEGVGVIGGAAIASSPSVGKQNFDALMNAVYHRGVLMQDYSRDVGISYANPADLVVNIGYTGTAGTLPAGTIVTYPTANSVDAYPFWESGGELPNPTPSIAAGTIIGGPISVTTGSNAVITAITAFTLIDSNGAVVPTLEIDASNDTNHEVNSNMAFIVPKSKLNLGSTYTATFAGSVGGVPKTLTWSFTTPAAAITLNTAGPYVVHNGGSLTIDVTTPAGNSSGFLLSATYPSSTGTPTLTTTNSSLTIGFPAGYVSSPQTFNINLQDSVYTNVTTQIQVTVEP